MFDDIEGEFVFYTPEDIDEIDIDENEDSFERNATLKAREYSKNFDGLVVATDGGVLIPAIPQWNPLYTRRFAGADATDEDRVELVLDMMRDKSDGDRRMYWQEAIALCKDGERLFSVAVDGIEGVMGHHFDPLKYKPGIWLCSIWEFPQFEGKNFFDLDKDQQLQVEISWTKLGSVLHEYLATYKLLGM